MKKLMSLIIIILLLVVVWGGANWFIGQKTEQLVKDYIAAMNDTYSKQGIQLTLVEYNKVFSGATVVTGITIPEQSSLSPIADLLSNIRVKSEVQNGPILWGEQGLKLGLSRWRTTIDEDSSESLELRAMLKELFQGKEPLVNWTDVNLDASAVSTAKVNPLVYEEEDKRINIAGMEMSSEVKNIATKPYVGVFSGSAGKMEFQDRDVTVTLPSMEIQGNITGMLAASMLGDINFQTQDVSVLGVGNTEPLMFNVDVKSSTKAENDNLSGVLNLNVKEIKGTQDQVKNVSYQLTFSDIDAMGLEAFSQLQMQMQNLQSQIVWNNDKTEAPEGQKKMLELFTQIQELTDQMMETLFSKTLIRDKSRIHQVLDMDNLQGKVVADADLTYVGSDNVPNIDSFATYSADQWAALLKGDIKIHADKALFPPMAAMMLAEPLANNSVVETKDQYHLTLRLQGDTVDLNGDIMTFSEMMAKLIPQQNGLKEGTDDDKGNNDAATPAEIGADLDLPEDILQQIEENGFVPEVMQLIEESDDISQEAKALLKQLQQMEAAGLIAADKDTPETSTEETTEKEAQ